MTLHLFPTIRALIVFPVAWLPWQAFTAANCQKCLGEDAQISAALNADTGSTKKSLTRSSNDDDNEAEDSDQRRRVRSDACR